MTKEAALGIAKFLSENILIGSIGLGCFISTQTKKINEITAIPKLIGYFSMGIGLLGMCFFEENTNYALIAVFTIINGLGIGFSLPSTTVALLSSVPRERSGMASATINAMRQTVVALGVAVIGSIISSGALNSLSSALSSYHLSASENTKAAQAIWASNGSSVPAAIPASLDSIEKLYKSAFLSGYHMSTLVIGLVTVAMAVVIISLKLRAEN